MHIGVDVGGTNLAAGLVDDAGHILRRVACATAPERGAQTLVDDIISLCQHVSEGHSRLASIGLGIPGLVDNERGLIIETCNIPLNHTPIAQEFGRFFSVPIHLHNDANAAAWGEHLVGAGRGVENMIMLTLGTGLGSGLILNGRVYEGHNGAAGELGHIVLQADGLPCSCGQAGCWELYASARALVGQTREAMLCNRESLLWQMVGGDLSRIDGKTAFQAARQGDQTASEVLERYFFYLAAGLMGVVNIFQPELICLGGGIGQEGEGLIGPLRRRLDDYSFLKSARKTKLAVAQLGNDAGIIGAALLKP